MNKGVIWMLHGVEEDSPRTNVSQLYRNLMIPPTCIENLISAARERGYAFVSMAQFLADKHDGECHRNILVTIDDGLKNIYSNAFPLFRRLKVPFVFFVATGLIENGFSHCCNAEMDGMAILCDHCVARGDDFQKLFRRFRHIRRFLPFLSGQVAMRLMLGHSIDFDCYRREMICSPSELREMVDSGWCELGSHTVNHVHLDRVRQVERELIASKEKIKAWTQHACEYFSYPYGHVDARSLALVRRHFRAATKDVVAPFPSITENDDDCMLLRVICTRDSTIETLLPEEIC